MTGSDDHDPAMMIHWRRIDGAGKMNNVGVALSHRCQDAPATPAAAQMETGMGGNSSSGSNSAADDLNEAIECAREIKTRATRESADYLITLLNLASRLMRRYGRPCRSGRASARAAVAVPAGVGK